MESKVGYCSWLTLENHPSKIHNSTVVGMLKGKVMEMCTHRKFNIAPENKRLEDYIPFGKVTFQGLR